MSVWGKLAGAAAGLAIGGPIGALLGGVAGHYVIDRDKEEDGPAENQVAFTVGVIALGAKMAKADGVVTMDEVNAFKEVFKVPEGEMKNVARVFNLAITNGDDRNWIANGFVSKLNRSGVKVETVVLDERSTDLEVEKAIEKAKSADLVLASLYGRVRSGQVSSVGVPDAGAHALSALIAAKMPIVGISFGNPYLLQSFPGLRTYLVAYGDMPSLQQAVARALVGEIDVVGKLPISLPGLYPRGTGIQVTKIK